MIFLLGIAGFFAGKSINEYILIDDVSKKDILLNSHKSLFRKAILSSLIKRRKVNSSLKFSIWRANISGLICSILWITSGIFSNMSNNSLISLINLSGGILLSTILFYISIFDIDKMLVSKRISLYLMLLGFLNLGLSGLIKESTELNLTFANHLLAAFISLLILITINLLGERFYGKTILGLGDACLSSAGGAWLGTHGISTALSIAFLLGSLFTLIGKLSGKLKRFQAFPFTPFISLGIWIVWLCGPNLI